MTGHECYHCKQWIPEGVEHDCWTTTEKALTAALSDDLREAWELIRETAVELGEQRIYASHNSIMFSRKSCYFFVRPKQTLLEVCVFLGRAVKSPRVSKAVKSSKTKVAHLIKVRHPDEVAGDLADWLREAYGLQDQLATPATMTQKNKPAASKRDAVGRGSSTAMQKVKTTPAAHIKSLPDDVRKDVAALHKLISSELKGLPATLWEGKFWGGSDQRIIGYGDFVYKGSRGKEVNWFLVGLAAQKNYISLYVNAVEGGKYLAEKYRKRLGKVKIGKASISFARLADMDAGALRELLKNTKKSQP